MGCPIVQTAEGVVNIFCNFSIVNNTDHKLVFRIDHEQFCVGNIMSRVDPHAPHVISARGHMPQRSGAIVGVTGRHDTLRCNLIIRFGPNEDDLNMRWHFEADIYLPPMISDHPSSPMGGFLILKNEFEHRGA
jgi:hypothetical protein